MMIRNAVAPLVAMLVSRAATPAYVKRAIPSAMRVRARSMAPLRICGPGTSTMQGQKATSVAACDSWKRLAAAATTPAINAAQSGWIGGLLLTPDSQRRTSAPMAALAAISSRLFASSVPKMTPSEAAPMAANKVKRGVEAGGSRAADSSADCAASADNYRGRSDRSPS